jgi:hypothetical protein
MKIGLPSRHCYMKILFGLLILIAAGGCREVKLAGTTWVTEPEFSGTMYRFTSDSTFEMRGWSCMANDTGQGIYRLTKDSLIFYYDSLSTAKKRVITVDSSGNFGDSCTISIQCRDEDYALPYVIVLMKTQYAQRRPMTSTIDGQLYLKVARWDFPVTFEFRNTGYVSTRITVPNPGDYKLDVKMSMLPMLVVGAGEVHAYALKKLSKKVMKLGFDYTDAEGRGKAARKKFLRMEVPYTSKP